MLPDAVIAGQTVETVRQLLVPKDRRFRLLATHTDCGCTSLAIGATTVNGRHLPLALETGRLPIKIVSDTHLKSGDTAIGYSLLIADEHGKQTRLTDRFQLKVLPSITASPRDLKLSFGEKRQVIVTSATDLSQLTVRAAHPDLIHASEVQDIRLDDASNAWKGTVEVTAIGTCRNSKVFSWIDLLPEQSSVDPGKLSVTMLPENGLLLSAPKLWIPLDYGGGFPVSRTVFVQAIKAGDLTVTTNAMDEHVAVKVARLGPKAWKMTVSVLSWECESFNVELRQGRRAASLAVEVTQLPENSSKSSGHHRKTSENPPSLAFPS
ncbi:hypothetical protein [Roseimaritima sediminicola]|uniref:hypothetical protein n=1 Tax=Roseimaritima sediminicola TaxID=2662066 RepID=UPI00129848F0|nr:hypothetical protein [Roseimaritima sediminicola]